MKGKSTEREVAYTAANRRTSQPRGVCDRKKENFEEGSLRGDLAEVKYTGKLQKSLPKRSTSGGWGKGRGVVNVEINEKKSMRRKRRKVSNCS